jgi:uncharacterized protein YjaZ
MPIRLHFSIDTRLSVSECERVRMALEGGIACTQRLLAIDDVDVSVMTGARFVIPKWGIGGYTSGPSQIQITLDPENPCFRDAAMTERLSSVIAHELHHARRMRGPGYGTTLGEALVTEGLAQVFERETGHEPAFYSHAVSGKALEELAGRALPVLNAAGYDHAAWFFGRKSDPLYPRHGSYALAYALARAWLDFAEMSAATAVEIDARAVLDPWRAGILRLAFDPPQRQSANSALCF